MTKGGIYTEKKNIYGVLFFFMLLCVLISGYGYIALYGTPNEKGIQIVPNFCEPGLRVNSLELSVSGPLSISYTIGPDEYSTERRDGFILVNSSTVSKEEWKKLSSSEEFYLFARNYIGNERIVRVEGMASTNSVLYRAVEVDSFKALGFISHLDTENNDYIQVRYSPDPLLYLVVFIITATIILLFW